MHHSREISTKYYKSLTELQGEHQPVNGYKECRTHCTRPAHSRRRSHGNLDGLGRRTGVGWTTWKHLLNVPIGEHKRPDTKSSIHCRRVLVLEAVAVGWRVLRRGKRRRRKSKGSVVIREERTNHRCETTQGMEEGFRPRPTKQPVNTHPIQYIQRPNALQGRYKQIGTNPRTRQYCTLGFIHQLLEQHTTKQKNRTGLETSTRTRRSDWIV